MGPGNDPHDDDLLRRGANLHELQLPDLLARLALGDGLDLHRKERDTLFELPFGLGALEEACHRRQIPLDRVLSLCWNEWSRAPDRSPPVEWLRDTRPELRDAARQLWMAAPDDAMTPALYKALARFARNPEDLGVWQWLRTPLWTDWIKHWGTNRGFSDGTVPFSVMPQAVAIDALRAGHIGPHAHEARRIVWAHFPEALLALVDELASAPTSAPDTLSNLTWSAPAHCVAALIERATQWVATPERFPATRSWVVKWLMDVVARRSPGWRNAYELLVPRNTVTTSPISSTPTTDE